MVTVNIIVTDEAVQPEIYLGRQGEKQAREIVFDLSALREKYGTGTATLYHQRSKDPAPYLIAETTGTTLTWTVSETDTVYAGIGYCEFRYTFGTEGLSKSTMFATNVKASLSGDVIIPAALQAWYDALIDYIKSRGNAGAGMTSDVISALLDCFAHVAWIDGDGQTYYDALENALHDIYWNVSNILTHCVSSNPATSITKGTQYLATITPSTGYTLDGAAVSVEMGGIDITSDAYSNGVINIPAVTGNLAISVSAELIPVTVESIEAVYTQAGTVYSDATLDSLKSDLVVTATYSDASTAVVPSADYVLSGTLVVGTSTITATYGGKTTTFDVTVTEDTHGLLNRWDLTSSYVDDIGNVTAISIDGATSQALPISSSGVVMDGSKDGIFFPNIFSYNRRYEIDISSAVGNMSGNGGSKGSTYGFGNGNLVRFIDSETIGNDGTESALWALQWRGVEDSYWIYANAGWKTNLSSYMGGPNAINGKTLWLEVDENGFISFGLDDTSIITYGTALPSGLKSMRIGNNVSSNGQCWRDMTITGVRVYDLTRH